MMRIGGLASKSDASGRASNRPALVEEVAAYTWQMASLAAPEGTCGMHASVEAVSKLSGTCVVTPVPEHLSLAIGGVSGHASRACLPPQMGSSTSTIACASRPPMRLQWCGALQHRSPERQRCGRAGSEGSGGQSLLSRGFGVHARPPQRQVWLQSWLRNVMNTVLLFSMGCRLPLLQGFCRWPGLPFLHCVGGTTAASRGHPL